MLKIILKDNNGRALPEMELLRLDMVMSADAPAASATAVMLPRGALRGICSIEVILEGETVFYGLVDEQTEQMGSRGRLLTLRARSREAILLDNEAMPQTYCLPSFGLIFERHFRPLGFTSFTGTDQVFNGKLTITKGMSEWSVLSAFCSTFTGTEPRVTAGGVIDISGARIPDRIHIEGSAILELRTILRRSAPISRIAARTFISGGYNMEFENAGAKELGIVRTRYVNAVGDGIKGTGDICRLLEKTQREYDTLELSCRGLIICSPGDIVCVQGMEKEYIIRELSCQYDKNGEKTIIRAEVNNNVA